MTADLIAVTVNYYCPLQVRMTDEEYGDWYEVDNGYALDNERAIRELLQKEQNEDLNDMADYFDGSESAKAKIVSAVWDVQEVNGELFGVICTGLREVLSPAEEQEWIDELIGQAADGFGEGLEQRPIRTADGEIYDDAVIRQILQCVIVESKEKIKVVFIGGMEVKAKVEQ